jgi:hypothetical protein
MKWKAGILAVLVLMSGIVAAGCDEKSMVKNTDNNCVVFIMHLYDNETAEAIAKYVGTASWRLPIYHYNDYDNWEVMQYYDIPSRYNIPSNPDNITSEKLEGWGNKIVIIDSVK